MKRLLGLAAAFGVLLAVSMFAVEGFDDRELFGPPPDAQAEQFVRAVVNGRYDQARAYLAGERSASDEELRALRRRLGDPSQVEARTLSRDDSRALVNVRVKEAERSEAVSFTLVFDREWKVVW